ncbi:MAG TPA: hypothetical protein VFH92_06275 [Phenylobacterium sp.]|nr:hypothetical protein [Phenylobacterium sp.]
MSDTEVSGGEHRKDQARALIDQAGQTIRTEAQSFASAAQDRVRAEAQKGAQTAGKTLGDFANAVRRAGDELDQAEQTPASRLVRQAAEGLEGLSRNLAEKDPGQLLDAVRDFGRRNPAAFIGGAVLLGVALGRFARASDTAAAAPRLDDDELEITETEAYSGSPEYIGAEAGIETPISDDLGDLSATPAAETASAPGVTDGGTGGGTGGPTGRGA